MIIRCRFDPPDAEKSGFIDMSNPETGEVTLAFDRVREAVKETGLRPCAKRNFHWLKLSACAKCRDRVEVPLEDSAREHEKGPLREQRAKEDENMRVHHRNSESSMSVTRRSVKEKVA